MCGTGVAILTVRTSKQSFNNYWAGQDNYIEALVRIRSRYFEFIIILSSRENIFTL